MPDRVPFYRLNLPTYCPARPKQAHDTFPGRKAHWAADRRWRAVRAAKLMMHPLCHDCHEAGRFEFANEVHHIRKRSDDPTAESWLDLDNLMSLCKRCHSTRTARGE